MGTPTHTQRSERQHKRITLLVTVALTATVITVAGAYWWSRAPKGEPLVVPQPMSKNVEQQSSGYTFTRSEEGRRIFTVHAARTVAFKQGGSTVLQDVFVEVFGPSGNRHDLLRTESCDYNPDSGELFAQGKVEIELNNPDLSGVPLHASALGSEKISLETSKVHFQQQGTTAETTEPVKFRSDRAWGSARGMTYDTRGGSLELENAVVLNVPTRGGPNPMPEATLTASRLYFDNEKQNGTLWGPIEITQGNRKVTAGRGTIVLEGHHRVAQALLEDGVRGVDKSQGNLTDVSAQQVRADFDRDNGELRSLSAEGKVEGEIRRGSKLSRLSAQIVEITFSQPRRRPLSGTASGSVLMSAESPGGSFPTGSATRDRPGAGKQELSAARVHFTFRPEDGTLKDAQTEGAGQLDFTPADPQSGKRQLSADPLAMDFDSRGRLETLRGLSRVRMVAFPSKQAASGRPEQESTSKRLKAAFDPATGALLKVDQTGDVHFREGDRNASAEQAVYDSQADALTLTGGAQAWDPETRTHADRILVELRNDTVLGLGHIQSTLSGAGTKAAARASGIPTNVVADRVSARREDQFIHYDGHVRAWHGQDVVEAPALDISKEEGRISATSGVLTSYIQPASTNARSANGATNQGNRPVTIRADRLDYADADRKGTYRGNVQLRTEGTTLRADRMDVYFSPAATAEASEVERAVATGHVSAIQPTRRATSEHAEYLAGQGKIVLTGGPPSMADATLGFTTGRSLTLYLGDDTIFVDGGDKSPTLSQHRISP